ncbi:divalent-cation tolerance protein CutA [Sphingomicrobium clamense]|uniref:Divalent-cation tolerance protein CutA n=1 Tax=Sphingomicrobium clamense TaxID=2851013 RepID=A0ABS6V731_9SPHN|nr:divalent-cation tolerance protein CutA [Sphingomicrobium sp. B8]MBW0145378.1 divalent-cation tolerance protein CutA [Sphingomicrobium sp. B8]
MTLASAWIVCADEAEATAIAEALVAERLAACCNILPPVSSVYRWDGKIERAREVPIIAKTDMDRADALIARVKELHSYDVPAIAIWPINAIPDDYARWIEENTGPDRIA